MFLKDLRDLSNYQKDIDEYKKRQISLIFEAYKQCASINVKIRTKSFWVYDIKETSTEDTIKLIGEDNEEIELTPQNLLYVTSSPDSSRVYYLTIDADDKDKFSDKLKPVFVSNGEIDLGLYLCMHEIYSLTKHHFRMSVASNKLISIIFKYIQPESSNVETYKLSLTEDEYNSWRNGDENLDKYYYKIDKDNNIKFYGVDKKEIEPDTIQFKLK